MKELLALLLIALTWKLLLAVGLVGAVALYGLFL